MKLYYVSNTKFKIEKHSYMNNYLYAAYEISLKKTLEITT